LNLLPRREASMSFHYMSSLHLGWPETLWRHDGPSSYDRVSAEAPGNGYGPQRLREYGGEAGPSLIGVEGWVPGLQQVHGQVIPTVGLQLQHTCCIISSRNLHIIRLKMINHKYLWLTWKLNVPSHYSDRALVPPQVPLDVQVDECVHSVLHCTR